MCFWKCSFLSPLCTTVPIVSWDVTSPEITCSGGWTFFAVDKRGKPLKRQQKALLPNSRPLCSHSAAFCRQVPEHCEWLSPVVTWSVSVLKVGSGGTRVHDNANPFRTLQLQDEPVSYHARSATVTLYRCIWCCVGYLCVRVLHRRICSASCCPSKEANSCVLSWRNLIQTRQWWRYKRPLQLKMLHKL